MKYSMHLVLLVMFFTASLHLLQAQWIQSNGLTVEEISCLAAGPDGSNLYAGIAYGSNIGAYRSTNNGASWTAVNTGLTNLSVNALAISPNGAGGTNVFAGTWGGGVFLSTNNGINWTEANDGLASTTLKIFSFAVSPNGAGGSNIFAATWKNGVFRSIDNGKSWTSVGLIDIMVYAFAVFPNGTGGTNIFAGCGYGQSGGGVYLSTNEGTDWTQVNNGLTNIDVRYIEVSTNGAGGTNLFVGTIGGGVFLSTNNGINWTQAGLTNLWVFSLAVFPNGAGGSNIFAGTWSSGVFLSTNNGTNWTAVNNGLTTINIIYLTISGTNIFAGTFRGGVWRRPLSEIITSIESFSNNLPEYFVLEQNYPNPFNPSTKISWQSAVSSWQTLKVFDVLGNEIATLVDEYKPAGVYEVEFNSLVGGKQLASGIYFYQLRVGDFVTQKKMILTK